MLSTPAAQHLEIATLPLPGGKGVLGLSRCPGYRRPGSPASGHQDALAQDLANIRAWGATAVVTLMEDHEFDLLQVASLGERAETQGLEWHHLPIPDMAAPDWRFAQRWLYSGLRLRRLLCQGARVLLHCRAGLGRSGTIAAHLVVELGMPPGEAIQRVRHIRPGAIQTQAQVEHVHRTTAIPPSADASMARNLACLLGGALGDACGSILGRQTHRPTRLASGAAQGTLQVSPLTRLGLFTLEGLIRALLAQARDDAGLLRHVRLSLRDWEETQGAIPGSVAASRLMKHAVMYGRREPRRPLQAALAGLLGGSQPRPGHAGGSRPLACIAPLALLPGLSSARVYGLAGALCKPNLEHSHAEPAATLPASLLAVMLRLLLAGQDLNQAVSRARGLALQQAGAGSASTLARLQGALQAARLPHPDSLPADLGRDSAPNTLLATGLYAASHTADFTRVLGIAAQVHGDPVTACVIAGQLFGAQAGLESLPHAWIRRLDVLDALCDVLDWGQPVWRGWA